jgi:hypothetical protein
MHLLFVHHVLEDRGSAQDMFHYARVAAAMGHEIRLYGPPNPESKFNYSQDVDSADAVIFIFEWTTDLQFGGVLGWTQLLRRFPRRRRIVIDCDGKYNDAISVAGDVNHPDAESSRRWVEICDSLSDTIVAPTHRPLRPNVRPFFFHGYDPSWEVPLDQSGKQFGMVYVGNNWFRWRGLERVLKTSEKIRGDVGRITLVGNGWDKPAPWANPTLPEDAYKTDPEFLRRLGVETVPPVKFDQVIDWMGRGIFSPVIYRPLFDHLRLVTCRTFETPAANTIPLFCQDEAYVREIYGEVGVELVLPADRPEEKILDLLRRPEHYLNTVREIRAELARRYAYVDRVEELVEMAGS